MRSRLPLLPIALVLAACGQTTTLRLSIQGAADLGSLQRLRVVALVAGTGARATFTASVTGRDLDANPYVLELDVAADSRAGDAVVSVLADVGSTPVASALARVALSGNATVALTLTGITAGCDADGDGFKPCAARADCCTALEAEAAADCDDTAPAFQPFAEVAACRTCDQVAACLASDLPAEASAEEGPERVEPVPDKAEPAHDAVEPDPDVAEPGPEAVEPAPDLVELLPDVPPDLPIDTACDCATGDCCDGCHYRPITTVCTEGVSTTTFCTGSGCGADVRETVSDRHCPGDAATCTGAIVARPSTLLQDCPDYQTCWEADGAHCIASAACADQVCPAGMVVVPEGLFHMGCNAALDEQCDAKEKPQHPVATPAFCIDIFEVGRADYALCAAGPCTSPGTGGDCVWDKDAVYNTHPINCVTWAQAKAYCEWREARLCSEAEWEKAARGGCEVLVGDCVGAEPVYGWGNDCPAAWGHGCTGEAWGEGTAAANCNEGLCHDGHTATSPVDAFASYPSPYDLASMSGNVAEWVADCWHASYDASGDGAVDAPTDGSAWTTGCESSGRIVRGGSWGSSLPAYLRTSYRQVLADGTGPSGVGIRCCRSIP